MNTQCPKCKSELVECPGIGPFCSNENCDVLDGIDMDVALTFVEPDDDFTQWVESRTGKSRPALMLTATHVSVLQRENCADIIYITLDAPGAIFPWNEPPILCMEAAQGNGVEYVRDVFGREPDEVYKHDSG